MSYFPPYGNKQPLGKIAVQNRNSQEKFQFKTWSKQVYLLLGTWGARLLPIPHVAAAVLVCVSATSTLTSINAPFTLDFKGTGPFAFFFFLPNFSFC